MAITANTGGQNRDDAAPPLIGSLVGGRYRVDALVGRGGMGEVYRATDESLGRNVALKILRSSAEDEAAVRRERAEVTLLASLNHRALVTLFDASEFEVDGEPRTCLVMEFVDGPTLSQLIHDRAIEGDEITMMLVDLAEALSVVHGQGVIHRDIKPANILLGASQDTGREYAARLADFGIAYLVDSTRLTQAGLLIGTAAYLSPEQATGAEPSSAADIYSLGLVMLETLTGRREFEGTMIESVAARLSRDPAVPSWLPADWRALLAAMTSRDEAARPTAPEVAARARTLSTPAAEEPAPTVAQTVQATREVLPPTAVMPAAESTAVTRPTERLAPVPEVAPSSSPRPVSPRSVSPRPVTSRRSAPRRKLLLIVAVVAAVVIAIVLISIGSQRSTAPETAPTLPAVDGELGSHLQQLFDEVGQ